MTGAAGKPLGISDQSLVEQVYDWIRSRIIEGDFPAESRIREREIAEELGVSRIPVREALPRLEHEGFIVNVPRRGAFVRPLTYQDAVELFEVRSALEVLAARLAAAKVAAGTEDAAPLRSAHDRAASAVAAGDATLIASTSSAFHLVVYELAGNGLLRHINVPVQGRVSRLFRLEASRDQPVILEEHRRLCDAISTGDVVTAELLALEHVEHSRDESLQLLRASTSAATA